MTAKYCSKPPLVRAYLAMPCPSTIHRSTSVSDARPESRSNRWRECRMSGSGTGLEIPVAAFSTGSEARLARNRAVHRSIQRLRCTESRSSPDTVDPRIAQRYHRPAIISGSQGVSLGQQPCRGGLSLGIVPHRDDMVTFADHRAAEASHLYMPTVTVHGGAGLADSARSRHRGHSPDRASAAKARTQTKPRRDGTGRGFAN